MVLNATFNNISVTDTAVSSVNKTDRHDVTEILLKVAFNTITQTKQNHLKKYVVFAGDENTYVNDLLEDIIVTPTCWKSMTNFIT
jgi:hypothetical protein